jgi:hypothetical protein
VDRDAHAGARGGELEVDQALGVAVDIGDQLGHAQHTGVGEVAEAEGLQGAADEVPADLGRDGDGGEEEGGCVRELDRVELGADETPPRRRYVGCWRGALRWPAGSAKAWRVGALPTSGIALCE